MNILNLMDVDGIYKAIGGEENLIDREDFPRSLEQAIKFLKITAKRKKRSGPRFTALNQMSGIQRKYFFKIGPWQEVPDNLGESLRWKRDGRPDVCSYSPKWKAITAWSRTVFDPRGSVWKRGAAEPYSEAEEGLRLLQTAVIALERGALVSGAEVVAGLPRAIRRRRDSYPVLWYSPEVELLSPEVIVPEEVNWDHFEPDLTRRVGDDWAFGLVNDPWQRFLNLLTPDTIWKVGHMALEGEFDPGVVAFHDGEKLVAGIAHGVARSE